MSAPRPLRLAIVAGENSGDALGAALIDALRARTDIEVRGVAGPAMRAAGCQALADAHELAVMGLIEPIRHLPRLWRLRAKLLSELLRWQPSVFIGVDAPAFNLNLAAHFKRRGVATVQYVSPQIWAWRQGRARTIAQRCDLVLCLLPFEPAFYARYAVRAQFVGHPLADQVPLKVDHVAARAELGLAADAPLLALLPGSRVGEVQRLARPFIESARRLHALHPTLQTIAPMANTAVDAEFRRTLAVADVQSRAAPGNFSVRVLQGQARTALMAADLGLVASGTATLEALLCRCPMVVAYRVSAATALLVRSLRLVRLPQFSLPNLLAGKPLVSEFFQEAAIPANLCAALEGMMDEGTRRALLLHEFEHIHAALRAGGAARAADEVLALLQLRGVKLAQRPQTAEGRVG